MPTRRSPHRAHRCRHRHRNRDTDTDADTDTGAGTGADADTVKEGIYTRVSERERLGS